MEFEYKVYGGDFVSTGKASSEVKKVLRELGFSPSLVRRVVVALYEGEVNIAAHAWEGTINIEISEDKVRMVLEDKGPGIPDIEKAMQEGYSTAGPGVREMGFGAGMGLPNMKKNTDFLKIDSVENSGTRVEMINYTK